MLPSLLSVPPVIPAAAGFKWRIAAAPGAAPIVDFLDEIAGVITLLVSTAVNPGHLKQSMEFSCGVPAAVWSALKTSRVGIIKFVEWVFRISKIRALAACAAVELMRTL